MLIDQDTSITRSSKTSLSIVVDLQIPVFVFALHFILFLISCSYPLFKHLTMIIQFYTPLAYCIKREKQRSFCLCKKSPMLFPLMSRICKLRADVKREFSDLGENYLAGGYHPHSRWGCQKMQLNTRQLLECIVYSDSFSYRIFPYV
jgi:hypothetical protein